MAAALPPETVAAPAEPQQLTNLPNLSDTALQHPGKTCPRCGAVDEAAHEAQRRIVELEAQVKILTSKATSAVDKLADYEDELRRLKATQAQAQQQANGQTLPTPAPTPPPLRRQTSYPTENIKPTPADQLDAPEKTTLPPAPAADEAPTLQHKPSVRNRFAFLARSNSHSPGSSATAAAKAAAAASSARENDLTAALSQERTLREAAEGKVQEMNGEIEELSSTLFQQANEMVASERRARAKLEERAARFEERCGTLEEKVRTLEGRDADKRLRLERLEVAIGRIDRLRRVLDGQPARAR